MVVLQEAEYADDSDKHIINKDKYNVNDNHGNNDKYNDNSIQYTVDDKYNEYDLRTPIMMSTLRRATLPMTSSMPRMTSMPRRATTTKMLSTPMMTSTLRRAILPTMLSTPMMLMSTLTTTTSTKRRDRDGGVTQRDSGSGVCEGNHHSQARQPSL
jgi:hypothetical protein